MKRVAPGSELRTVPWAVDEILHAVCGYAQHEGRHICKVVYRATDPICDPVDWQTLKARIAEVVGQLVEEPAVRPVEGGAS